MCCCIADMNHANTFRGQKLKKIRTLCGFTQGELGHYMGYISRSPITKFEAGRDRPNNEMEAKLCKFFKVEPDYFRK